MINTINDTDKVSTDTFCCPKEVFPDNFARPSMNHPVCSSWNGPGPQMSPHPALVFAEIAAAPFPGLVTPMISIMNAPESTAALRYVVFPVARARYAESLGRLLSIDEQKMDLGGLT
jgi:hypothetical protein